MTNNIKQIILEVEDIIPGKPMRSDNKVLFCGNNFIRDLENIKNNYKYD